MEIPVHEETHRLLPVPGRRSVLREVGRTVVGPRGRYPHGSSSIFSRVETTEGI